MHCSWGDRGSWICGWAPTWGIRQLQHTLGFADWLADCETLGNSVTCLNLIFLTYKMKMGSLWGHFSGLLNVYARLPINSSILGLDEGVDMNSLFLFFLRKVPGKGIPGHPSRFEDRPDRFRNFFSPSGVYKSTIVLSCQEESGELVSQSYH